MTGRLKDSGGRGGNSWTGSELGRFKAGQGITRGLGRIWTSAATRLQKPREPVDRVLLIVHGPNMSCRVVDRHEHVAVELRARLDSLIASSYDLVFWRDAKTIVSVSVASLAVTAA